MKKWDRCEQEFIFDHGWRLDNDEMLHLTQKQFMEYQYAGVSMKDKTKRTIMLPSTNGCCLIFEGVHFKIDR